jgi:hypothetical protein
MQNTLKLGPNYDYSSFMKLPAEQKTQILTQLEKEKVVSTRLAKYQSREATEQDVAYINSNAQRLDGKGAIAPIKKGDLIYYSEQVKPVSEYNKGTDTEEKGKVISESRWNSMKSSGFKRGVFEYKWNNNLGVFEEIRTATVEGLPTREKTGNVAKTPQELGNLTSQNWSNYEGFEVQEPEAITQRVIGPVDLESELNI